MRPIAPPRLERGQTIGVVAPAGPVNPVRLAAGLARLGDAFRVKLAPTLERSLAESAFVREPGVPSYLAASDDTRAGELSALLADPDVRAVVLARGGYGLMRILPRLDPSLVQRDPKPIVGFSDATALLGWAYAAGVRGIHGPMIAQLADLPDGDVVRLIDILTDPAPPGVRPWSLVAHGTGVYRGPLITANLTLASMLVGTPWALPLAGAITIFEEVGERPYELDRYMTQLALTGALAQPAAIVLGDLTRCVDHHPPTGQPDPADAAEATILERLRTAGIAAATGAPIGHGNRNEAVPFGALALLDLDRATLEITEGAVA
ncbi:MAG: LD-carboxypeptidase [Kofleriaceae bacterium]|nr:LD-carboxypeptidase [Kofleriaceae bacterium]